MTSKVETNPRWLSAAFTAVPILLSILYAVVVHRSPRPDQRPATRTPTEVVSARTP